MAIKGLEVGQVRYYAKPGETCDDWRVVQEVRSEKHIIGGYVEKTANGLFYVRYPTYSTWRVDLIGDLVTTWTEDELAQAVELGLRLAGK